MDTHEFGFRKVILQITLVIVYVLLLPTIIVPLLATIFLYEFAFSKRADKPRHKITDEDYPDLVKKEVEFPNDKIKLRGAIFQDKNVEKPKALIVVSHGIGCNMNLYTNRINYFAKKGYVVMGFDMTGTGNSEGSGLVGASQSEHDIKYAVKYARSLEEYKDLKLFVYGHSWSGYGCAAMLNDDSVVDKVDAVATMSGFNDVWNCISFQAQTYCGNFIYLAYPWIMMWHMIKYGKEGNYKGIEGINNFKKAVLITQSKDDPTVPTYLSVYGHKDECTNPNAKFVLYEDRGHTTSRPIEVEKQINEDLKGKVYDIPLGKYNMFQYFVNQHYEWSSTESVKAIDFDFMDTVDNFFEEQINA